MPVEYYLDGRRILVLDRLPYTGYPLPQEVCRALVGVECRVARVEWGPRGEGGAGDG